MRFLQNMLLRMVARRLELKTSVPKSLRTAILKIRTYGFPNEVCTLVEQYWNTSGAGLKDYRDLDQHYFTLSKQVRLQWSPEERVLIFLPDNPNITAESELTFTKEIDALPYFVSGFNHFHQCVELISSKLGFERKALQEELDTSGLGKLDEGIRQTLALWVENSRTGETLEMGQLEDRRLYFNRRMPQTEKVSNTTTPEGLQEVQQISHHPPRA